MPKIIYRERFYSNDRLDLGLPIAVSFKRKKAGMLSDSSFIEKAIDLSNRERISIDILDDTDRLCADFIFKTSFISDKATFSLEELAAESEHIEIIISEKEPPTVKLRFGRYKN